MKIHPIADKFPLLKGAEFQQMVESIRDSGLRDAIVTWRGRVIDGRNRLRACEAAGVTPRFEEGDFASEHEVLRFIIDMNIVRRQLTAGQLAMLGEELRPGLEVEAKERQRLGQEKGRQTRHGKNNLVSSEVVRNQNKSDRKEPGNVNAQIGLAVGVGAGTVAVASKVKKSAPELVDKVISGEMSLNAAYRTVAQPRKKERPPAPPPPPVDVKSLSGNAREKLEAAIRQEKRRLQHDFEQAVQVALADALEDTVLPNYNKQMNDARKIIETRKGFMTRATYRLILSWLHPDRVRDQEQKASITKAFHAFSELELALLNEKEMPTITAPIPRNYQEWAKRREEVKAQRRRGANGVTNKR